MTSEPFNWNNLVLLIISILSAWTTWRVEQRSKTAKEERKTLESVANQVETIHKETNGLTAKLVASEKAISKAEGKIEERAEVADRQEEERLKAKEPQ